MRLPLLYFIFISQLLIASTVNGVHPGTEVFYRDQAVETSPKPVRRGAIDRIREWRRRRRHERSKKNPFEKAPNEHMSASVQSIDSLFIGDSRDVILNARDTMTSLIDSHYQEDGKVLARKYHKELSRIPTEDTAFAIYLKDALIGYNEMDLAAPFFAFRIKGRYDLIDVIKPHLAERVSNKVDNDINQIWPILADGS